MSQSNTPPVGASPFIPPPFAPPPVPAAPSSTRRWVKPLRFGLLGAVGCLLAALLGEGWLWLMRPAPPPPPPATPARPPQAVALVLDTSGSMAFSGLSEVQEAAKEYLDTQNLQRDRTAIVHFDSGAEISAPLSHDHAMLETAVSNLYASGTTAMDQGLNQGDVALQGATEARSVLLFTDGSPDDGDAALQAANTIRSQGIQLVVVATDDADFDFLRQLTGDPSKVIEAKPGAFTQAFQQAQRIIYGYDLTSSAPTKDDTRSLTAITLVNAIWTALLGLGVAVALVWGQAHYFHRRLFEKGFAKRDALGLVGGVGAGLASGAVAQVFFATAGSSGAAELGRLLSWAMLGGILAGGMALYVPNLDGKRALLFGGSGGLIAAMGYIILAQSGSDTVARLASATLLGFAIGLLVAFAEEKFRRAWLRVEGVGKSEIRFDVNLGAEPIAVGADRSRCLIYAPGAAPVEGRFGLEGGQPYFQRGEAPREWLTPDESREFSSVRVTLSQPRSEREAMNLPYGTGAPPLPGYAPQYPAQGSQWSNSPHPVADSHTYPSAPYGAALPYGAPPLASGASNAYGQPSYGQSVPPIAATLPTQWRLEHPTQTVEINVGQTLNVGRLPDNDVVVGESSVSSSHARLLSGTNGLFITDLNSTNGTWGNEVRLAPETLHPLHEGDQVRLGALAWQVRGVS